MSKQTHITYCRICEALCGLKVTAEGDQVVEIRPDGDHPLSQGYACVKGLKFGGVHHDPDRLNHPMKRVGDRWEPLGWEVANREIGDKIRLLTEIHGPECVGMYIGNPSAFHQSMFFLAGSFMKALNSPNLFSSSSVDCNNKFEAASLMFGSPTLQPIPDLSRTKFLLCLGSNPAVSQMSFINAPNALDKLRQIEKRGGRVILVDPRKTETAELVGEHLFIRPGSDAYLVAALLQVLFKKRLHDATLTNRFADGLSMLEKAVSGWTPQRVEPITGIPAKTIAKLAEDFASADGAAFYMSTGPNMGPFGTVTYALGIALNLVTGNLDREGGSLFANAPIDMAKLSHWAGVGRSDKRSRVGHWPQVIDAFPSNLLADEILEEGQGKIRALIVVAGDPLMAIPHGKLEKALENLELVVGIDIYPNETSRVGHYLLPATDFLERADIALPTSMTHETPFIQYTERVFAPSHQRKEEWEIFYGLLRAIGPSLLNRSPLPAMAWLDGWMAKIPGLRSLRLTPPRQLAAGLGLFSRLSLKTLRRNPRGVFLPDNREGSFLGIRPITLDRRVSLAPMPILNDMLRMAKLESSFLETPEGTLRLIGRRLRNTHNGWMLNNRQINHAETNEAMIHPDDAKALGIGDGGKIKISHRDRSVTLPVKITPTVMPGTLVVPHGWGHRNRALGKASNLEGININEVIPGGQANIEPVSGQSIMVGSLARVEGA